MSPVQAPRPILTFDLDGVLCRPPFGINPGKGMHKRRGGEGAKSLLWHTERWRYAGRRPMEGARSGLELLSTRFDCRIVSARSNEARAFTESWLGHYLGSVPPLHLREDWHEKPAQFKARKVVELGAVAHFEDDAHTAQWLAELLPAVFVIDWWRNRWLHGDNIHRISRIAEAVPLLDRLTTPSPGQ